MAPRRPIHIVRGGPAVPGGRGRWIRLYRVLALVPALGLGCGIDLLDSEAPGHLVPATAAEDPLLPQLRVEVSGVERALHLRRFGDPRDPVVLVLPGGPGGDFRLLLPLEELADDHHVVMWDPRGAGLSEGVTARELTLDGFAEEIRAVHAAVAPGRPAILIGHSFGALLMMRYAAAHPEAVEKLILIEPGGITGRARSAYRGGSVGFGDGQSFFWQNDLLTSTDHASADYKAVDLLPLASRSFTCSGRPPEPYPMWRFGAYHYHTVMAQLRARGRGFDWAEGLAEAGRPVVVVAGSCGAAGVEFQQAFNLEALPGAHLEVIPGADHISLFVQHAESTLARLRAHIGGGAGTLDEGSPHDLRPGLRLLRTGRMGRNGSGRGTGADGFPASGRRTGGDGLRVAGTAPRPLHGIREPAHAA